ncbi:hypothetical protein LEP1GSC072_3807 [Leptospira noguchii str. Bonito]|nr:hypothetical protein LEP1GSC072_3807 [Leptospira noguchii str. Bonito]
MSPEVFKTKRSDFNFLKVYLGFFSNDARYILGDLTQAQNST